MTEQKVTPDLTGLSPPFEVEVGGKTVTYVLIGGKSLNGSKFEGAYFSGSITVSGQIITGEMVLEEVERRGLELPSKEVAKAVIESLGENVLNQIILFAFCNERFLDKLGQEVYLTLYASMSTIRWSNRSPKDVVPGLYIFLAVVPRCE